MFTLSAMFESVPEAGVREALEDFAQFVWEADIAERRELMSRVFGFVGGWPSAAQTARRNRASARAS